MLKRFSKIVVDTLKNSRALNAATSSKNNIKYTSSNLKTMASEKSEFPVFKTDDEWKKQLTPSEYQVLRKKGTERPNTSSLLSNKKIGTYGCQGCGQPLYKSDFKFESGCGWPAFYDYIPGSIKINKDLSFGMERTEIVCSQCGSHLGHVFYGEGFDNPTDARHCVNGICLNFKEENSKK